MQKLQKEINIPKERKRKRRKWKVSQEKMEKPEKKFGDITRKKVLRFLLLFHIPFYSIQNLLSLVSYYLKKYINSMNSKTTQQKQNLSKKIQ